MHVLSPGSPLSRASTNSPSVSSSSLLDNRARPRCSSHPPHILPDSGAHGVCTARGTYSKPTASQLYLRLFCASLTFVLALSITVPSAAKPSGARLHSMSSLRPVAVRPCPTSCVPQPAAVGLHADLEVPLLELLRDGPDLVTVQVMVRYQSDGMESCLPESV